MTTKIEQTKFIQILKKKQVLFIALGLALGIVLGIVLPQLTFLVWMGKTFVLCLKVVAPFLVAALVISAITNINSGIGSKFAWVVSLYFIAMITAAIVSVVACIIFPITINLDVSSVLHGGTPKSILEVSYSTIIKALEMPWLALVHGNFLSILFWSLIGGLLIKKFAGAETKAAIDNISKAISDVVGIIVCFAPFGIMGLVYNTVSRDGIMMLLGYGKLVGLLVAIMLFVLLIIFPAIMFIVMGKNPYPIVFASIKKSGLPAFFYRSSAANIPNNLQLCEELGIDKRFYSVSIPLGCAINMGGAAVTIAVMTMTTANSLGMEVRLSTAILMCIVAILGACGTSGLAGGSILLIPVAASLLGISNDIAMEVVAIGYIISVIQDSMETALNSCSDVMFTAAADYRIQKRNNKKQDAIIKE